MLGLHTKLYHDIQKDVSLVRLPCKTASGIVDIQVVSYRNDA